MRLCLGQPVKDRAQVGDDLWPAERDILRFAGVLLIVVEFEFRGIRIGVVVRFLTGKKFGKGQVSADCRSRLRRRSPARTSAACVAGVSVV